MNSKRAFGTHYNGAFYISTEKNDSHLHSLCSDRILFLTNKKRISVSRESAGIGPIVQSRTGRLLVPFYHWRPSNAVLISALVITVSLVAACGGEDSAADSGGDQSDNSADGAGAVYIY
jgi:hypothetical protein